VRNLVNSVVSVDDDLFAAVTSLTDDLNLAPLSALLNDVRDTVDDAVDQVSRIVQLTLLNVDGALSDLQYDLMPVLQDVLSLNLNQLPADLNNALNDAFDNVDNVLSDTISEAGYTLDDAVDNIDRSLIDATRLLDYLGTDVVRPLLGRFSIGAVQAGSDVSLAKTFKGDANASASRRRSAPTIPSVSN
jgi:ABC-type transporter Mla subunit MlaD